MITPSAVVVNACQNADISTLGLEAMLHYVDEMHLPVGYPTD